MGNGFLFAYVTAITVLGIVPTAAAQEAAMWGFTPDRNLVSDEKGLPTKWDPATGENIKWKETLGSQTYAGPVMMGGKIFMGTNNQGLRNPKLTGDRGVVMAFREADGRFLWQSTHTKLAAGRVNDWPWQGVCSTPYVEGDRLYYISNRCEVVCVDTEGFRDGENDGPFKAEADTSDIDADIIWKLDMMAELDVFPHNLATCSPRWRRRPPLCGDQQRGRRGAFPHSCPVCAEFYCDQPQRRGRSFGKRTFPGKISCTGSGPIRPTG